MSKFYAGQSSSDSDLSSSSDDEAPIISRPSKPAQRVFLMSEDEEETRHVVKSAKEKCWDSMQDTIKLMQNARKIRDMSKLVDEFDNLTKIYTKNRSVILKEGTPRFYIKAMVETEDYVNEVWADKEARKKMSKLNSKSHGALRQKLRKYLKDFEQQVADYRENPDDGEEAVEEAVAEVDERKASSFLSSPAQAAMFVKDEPDDGIDFGAESDDDSMWGMSSDSDSDESGDEAGGARVLTAEYFLKKKPSDKDDEKEKKKKPQQREQKEKKKTEAKWEEVQGKGKGKTVTLFDKDTEITHAVVIKKLNEIILNRGRRSTHRKDQVELLKKLRAVGEDNNLGDGIKIRITFDITAALFDYNSKILDCMKPEPWNEVMKFVEEILDFLIKNPDIEVSEDVTQETENLSDEAAGYRISGSAVQIVEKLQREYIKILQTSDAHSTEYITHLREESRMISVINKLKNYVENKSSADHQKICAAYLLAIEYVYYKYDPRSAEQKKDVETKEDEENKKEVEEKEDKTKTSREIMKDLCQYIYTKDTSDRLRTRAILHHIYHHCLHDRWYEARDLMLMSHLQETIHCADVPTQIIYNRTMVQLGLCAFRQGLMKESHNALVDIQSTGRAKELLAQGLQLQRQGERISAEQEKTEKRRQIPFHMHINLELLECVYLVSAMLLEIPYVAAHEFDARRRMISKQFHHQLRVSERQSLLGPPDNMREHVVAGAKAMKMGDYRSCLNFIVNDKMNNKVWNLFHCRDNVVGMLEQKIKEESLCTYLFTYSQFYDNVSLDWLSSMFELDKVACHRRISKLIINEELAASWDQPGSSLVLHRTDPTRLQNMAMQLAEKVSTIVDMNERILEARAGGGGFQNQRNYDGGNRQGYRNNNYNRGGGGGRWNNNRNNYQNRGNNDRNYNNRSGGSYRGNRDGGSYRGNRDGGYRQGGYGGRGGYSSRGGGGYSSRGGYNNRR